GAFARVLSFVLLGFIFYGTTVEAVHTHGKLAQTSNVADARNVSVPTSETEASTKLLGCGDCLICQLHQHSSTGTVSVPPTLQAPAASSFFFGLNTVSVHSHV